MFITVLTDNTTHGINSCLISVPLSEGDAILVHSFIYLATLKATEKIAKQRGFKVRNVDIKLPINDEEEFVQLFEQKLENFPDIKMVIIDHISSSVPILWPVEKLMKLFKDRNIIVLIDGAHGPGQVSLNLTELDPDFYSASLHKWNFVPRSFGMLYVKEKYHEDFYNIISGARYDWKPFRKRFQYLSARDQTSLFCFEKSREFVEKVGGMDNIIKYNSSLMKAATKMLVEAWNTSYLPVPNSMMAPNMSLIKLPCMKKYPIPEEAKEILFTDYPELLFKLNEEFHINTSVFCLNGEAWIRISSQIFNSMHEYEKLRDVILTLSNE
ncbi:DgyrCDS7219 [Dimorphilus gyrociliatus]|uniref:DgyrCDS7219 n=1 Tax=Dimorphilus gyrociliatus TaxID=2664684 RepID=A0A7I8VQD0_9ANNE|nr:DgyrCDS7219 [Dimorphilus gyrociliatus]